MRLSFDEGQVTCLAQPVAVFLKNVFRSRSTLIMTPVNVFAAIIG